MTANDVGCASLLELLDMLASSNRNANIEIQLTRPTPAQLRVPNCRGGSAEVHAPELLRLHYESAEDVWRFPKSWNTADLTLGSQQIKQLAQGVKDISQGNGDYCIGHSDDRNKNQLTSESQRESLLRFWWSI